MKITGHISSTAARLFGGRWWAFLLLALLPLHSPAQSTVSLQSLPESSAAAKYVSSLATDALPSTENLSMKQKLALSIIEAGFLVGTTTAVHELGHASRVRSIGGVSRWETGDHHWWSYLSHRDPLARGVTDWMVPRLISTDERILIATAGFNATTMWDENVEGCGPFRMFTARYSTLLYLFSGVGADEDDLGQLVGLYAAKGLRISRQEIMGWQMLAGCIGELNSKVRAYAYFTPRGVSMRAVTRLAKWTVAAEAVVHGSARAELEVGRELRISRGLTLAPRVLVSPRGIGGSLQAEADFGRARLVVSWQRVPADTLPGARSGNGFDLQLSAAF